MKTITVTARSGFHGDGVRQSFRLPAKEGVYYRRCHNPCDYKKNKDGIAVNCGCGYPVGRTTWDVPEGWEVCIEWADEWMDCGANNIVITLSREAVC